MGEYDTSKVKTSNIDPYINFNPFNGAICGQYAWSQSINDIEVMVPIPSEIKKKNQVDLEIKSNRLIISYQQQEIRRTPVSGQLSKSIRVSESMWSLLPGQHIMVTLDKCEEKWWDKLVTTETSINMENIHVERDFHTLPEEDQAEVQKFMWNKQQNYLKSQGASVKNADILKKAWDAEGSPFKGQPFDPSSVQFENSFV